MKGFSEDLPSSAQASRSAPVAIVCCNRRFTCYIPFRWRRLDQVWRFDNVVACGVRESRSSESRATKTGRGLRRESNPQPVGPVFPVSNSPLRCPSDYKASGIASPSSHLTYLASSFFFLSPTTCACQAPRRPNPLPVYYASETAEAILTRSLLCGRLKSRRDLPV